MKSILAMMSNLNSTGNIKEIDGKSAFPKSVIPAEIWEYVNLNYPQKSITDWSLEKRKQEVKLENGTELIFNLKGDFLRIDD